MAFIIDKLCPFPTYPSVHLSSASSGGARKCGDDDDVDDGCGDGNYM